MLSVFRNVILIVAIFLIANVFGQGIPENR